MDKFGHSTSRSQSFALGSTDRNDNGPQCSCYHCHRCRESCILGLVIQIVRFQNDACRIFGPDAIVCQTIGRSNYHCPHLDLLLPKSQNTISILQHFSKTHDDSVFRHLCSSDCASVMFDKFACLQRDALRLLLSEVIGCKSIVNIIVDYCGSNLDLLPPMFQNNHEYLLRKEARGPQGCD